MDLSALIVVIILTVSFFGLTVWLAFQSRRTPIDGEPSNDRATGKGNIRAG